MIKKRIHPAFAASVSCALALACVACLAAFPVDSGKTLWSGYRALVVSPSASEAEVVSRLRAAGITEFATESNTLLSNSSDEAPVQPYLAKLNEERSRWFTDQEHDLRFFFLKNASFLDKRVERAFSDASLFRHLERGAENPRTQAIALLILLATGLATRGNRPFQVACAIPCVMLSVSFARPFGMLSSVSLLWGIIALAGSLTAGGLAIDARKAFLIAIRDRVAMACLALTIAFAVFGGFHGVAIAFAAGTAALALVFPVMRAVFAARAIIDRKRLHPRFKAVSIAGTGYAGRSTVSRYALPLAACLSAIAGITAIFVSQPQTRASTDSRVLYIPAPSRYTRHAGFGIEGYTELKSLRTDSSLPDLGDFVAAQWYIRTAPWRRVQDPFVPPEPGDTADYTWYRSDDSGVVTGSARTMCTFDAGFIRKTLADDSTDLERMLLGQGRFVTVEMTRIN
jgi:hypothetical protein